MSFILNGGHWLGPNTQGGIAIRRRLGKHIRELGVEGIRSLKLRFLRRLDAGDASDWELLKHHGGKDYVLTDYVLRTLSFADLVYPVRPNTRDDDGHWRITADGRAFLKAA